MGSLANWGAMAGVAKGSAEGSQEEYKRKQHTLDQQREERLQTLANTRQVARDDSRYERDQTLATQKQESDANLQTGRQTWTAGQATEKREFDAGESALERQNDLDVANIKDSGSSSRSSKDQYVYKQQPPTSSIDPASGAITETPGKLEITDKVTNATYVQENGIFRYASDDTPLKFPQQRQRAEKKLRDNISQDAGREYAKKFGYVPLFFFQELKSRGLADGMESGT